MKEYLLLTTYLPDGKYVTYKRTLVNRFKTWLCKVIFKSIKKTEHFSIKTEVGVSRD